MSTATIYKPEQMGGFKVNGVHPTDYVSYFAPMPENPGHYFVIVRDIDHDNPRTLVLSGRQLDSLRPAPGPRIPAVAARLATIFAFLLLAGVGAETAASVIR